MQVQVQVKERRQKESRVELEQMSNVSCTNKCVIWYEQKLYDKLVNAIPH